MKKRPYLQHIIVLVVLVVLAACKKADYLEVNAGERPPLNAQISFVNARPADVPLHFWIFTTQLTATAVGINQASPYLPALFGNVQINFTEGAGTSYKLSRQFGNQATFSANGGPNGPIAGYYHTVFAARSKADITKDTLILFYDNPQPPAAGKAKLRFVHLAPAVGAVQVSIQQEGHERLLFDTVDYGRAGGSVISGDSLNAWSLGPFVEVPAGASSLEVNTVTDHLPLAIDKEGFSHLLLEAGRSYTVFLNGVPGKAAIGGAIITHFGN